MFDFCIYYLEAARRLMIWTVQIWSRLWTRTRSRSFLSVPVVMQDNNKMLLEKVTDF